jgi:transposase
MKPLRTPPQAISEILGVGLLTATAAVATMGEAKAFRSGREFAAWFRAETDWHRRQGASAREQQAGRHALARFADARDEK